MQTCMVGKVHGNTPHVVATPPKVNVAEERCCEATPWLALSDAQDWGRPAYQCQWSGSTRGSPGWQEAAAKDRDLANECEWCHRSFPEANNEAQKR